MFKREGSRFKAIQEIQRDFDKAGLKHSVDERSDLCILTAGVSGKHNTYQIRFICKDPNSNDFALRVVPLVHCPENKRDAMARLINEFHVRYRFFKFVIDKDCDVNIEYDLPSAAEAVGKAAVEMTLRTMKLVDDVYPEIMRILWQ